MAVLRTVISTLYSLAGFAAFVTFLIVPNYPTAIWGLLTGLANGILTFLHMLKYKQTLRDWYTDKDLTSISYYGFSMFTLGAMGFTYHLAIEIMRKTPILPVQQSQVIPVIWCFITLKSGIILYLYARHYRINSQNFAARILEEEETTEGDGSSVNTC